MTVTPTSLERNSVFIVRPPENLNRYVLLVTKAGGPFGGGGQPSVFSVDDLRLMQSADGNPIAWQGVVFDGEPGVDEQVRVRVVCQFPHNSNYILVNSELVETMTPVEAATQQRAEDTFMTSLFGPDAVAASGDGGEAVLAVPTSPGQYL